MAACIACLISLRRDRSRLATSTKMLGCEPSEVINSESLYMAVPRHHDRLSLQGGYTSSRATGRVLSHIRSGAETMRRAVVALRGQGPPAAPCWCASAGTASSTAAAGRPSPSTTAAALTVRSVRTLNSPRGSLAALRSAIESSATRLTSATHEDNRYLRDSSCARWPSVVSVVAYLGVVERPKSNSLAMSAIPCTGWSGVQHLSTERPATSEGENLLGCSGSSGLDIAWTALRGWSGRMPAGLRV